MNMLKLILIVVIGYIFPITVGAQCIHELEWEWEKKGYEGAILLYEYDLCPYDEFVEVYYDEFNGNQMDMRFWKFDWTSNCNDEDHSENLTWYPRNSAENAISGNVIVENGELKIITKHDPQTVESCPGGSQTHPFTSGRIISKRSFSHGIFKIRANVPASADYGYNPAFWLWSIDACPNWHWHNEIDIFEFLDDNPKEDEPVFSTHRYWIDENCIDDGPHEFRSENMDCNIGFAGVYRTYGAVWTPRYVEWYIEDNPVLYKPIYTEENGSEVGCTIYPLHYYRRLKSFPALPMNIIINNNVSNKEGTDPYGNVPNTMKVDYLRVWQAVNCMNGTIYSSNLNDKEFNVFAGNTLTVDGSIKLDDNGQICVIASNEIILSPGFECTIGSLTEFRIDNNVCSE